MTCRYQLTIMRPVVKRKMGPIMLDCTMAKWLKGDLRSMTCRMCKHEVTLDIVAFLLSLLCCFTSYPIIWSQVEEIHDTPEAERRKVKNEMKGGRMRGREREKEEGEGGMRGRR